MLLPLQMMAAALAGAMALANTAGQASAQSPDTGSLQLEAKIPLGEVRGRIDHMTVDLKRHRLFVAELGKDSPAVIDSTNCNMFHTITGLKDLQRTGPEDSTGTFALA